MPGLISCAGVTGSGCIAYHAYATLLSGLKMSPDISCSMYMEHDILTFVSKVFRSRIYMYMYVQ